MVIECVCGEFHAIPTTGMILIIRSFIDGDLQTVGKQIVPMCIMTAFTEDNIAVIAKKYPKRQII